MTSRETSSRQELHVVLGAGQIGTKVAELLVARGHRVRIVRRSAAPSRVAGVEMVSVDLRDANAVRRVCGGAEVVYHCVNSPYEQWADVLLPMTAAIVDGVARTAARLVVLDNLYAYGDTSKLDEETPLAPATKKGRLRALAAEYMLDAAVRGVLSVSIGRASDFFGPETPRAVLGDDFIRRLFAGKPALVFGDLGQRHSYSFSPDVAAGLVALGSRKHTPGVWMLPVQPAETTRQVIRWLSMSLGMEIPTQRVPSWLLRTVGMVHPMARELAELTYQWEQPFVVHDDRFRAEFGFGATPWSSAVAETAAWARATYGGRASLRAGKKAA